MSDIRNRFNVTVRDHTTNKLVKGVYRTRCKTLGETVAQLEKDGHQTVTAIKRIYKSR